MSGRAHANERSRFARAELGIQPGGIELVTARPTRVAAAEMGTRPAVGYANPLPLSAEYPMCEPAHAMVEFAAALEFVTPAAAAPAPARSTRRARMSRKYTTGTSFFPAPDRPSCLVIGVTRR